MLTNAYDCIVLYVLVLHLISVVFFTDLYINNLDSGLASLSIANGDPFKLTSPASMHCAGNFVLEFPSINSPIVTTHARGKLVVCSTNLARMRHRENRRDREFMLGNSRMKLPDAMHAAQERWVWRGCGLAASAAPVVFLCYSRRHMGNPAVYGYKFIIFFLLYIHL